ncbi:unnamed protein product [marine sediment metagenome]|uniref:Uncharacterized protein n=1 Tax=marine sediment metagenome TaxID=412755 RepID=X1TKP0_9ZZZZ
MSMNGPSAITALGYLNVFIILRGKKLRSAKCIIGINSLSGRVLITISGIIERSFAFSLIAE